MIVSEEEFYSESNVEDYYDGEFQYHKRLLEDGLADWVNSKEEEDKTYFNRRYANIERENKSSNIPIDEIVYAFNVVEYLTETLNYEVVDRKDVGKKKYAKSEQIIGLSKTEEKVIPNRKLKMISILTMNVVFVVISTILTLRGVEGTDLFLILSLLHLVIAVTSISDKSTGGD